MSALQIPDNMILEDVSRALVLGVLLSVSLLTRKASLDIAHRDFRMAALQYEEAALFEARIAENSVSAFYAGKSSLCYLVIEDFSAAQHEMQLEQTRALKDHLSPSVREIVRSIKLGRNVAAIHQLLQQTSSMATVNLREEDAEAYLAVHEVLASALLGHVNGAEKALLRLSRATTFGNPSLADVARALLLRNEGRESEAFDAFIDAQVEARSQTLDQQPYETTMALISCVGQYRLLLEKYRPSKARIGYIGDELAGPQ